MGTTKSSKPLHNFAMPCDLRWGNQKHLRCMKLDSAGQIDLLRRSSDLRRREIPFFQSRDSRHGEIGRDRDSYAELPRGSHDSGDGCRRFGDGDDGIAAVRVKLMLDLQTAADRMKCAIFKDGFVDGEASGSPPPPPPPPPPMSAEGESSRPWNLRTRRAACKTPGDVSAAVGKGLMANAPKSDSGTSAPGDKSLRLRSVDGASAIGEKRERPKFAVALSKAEIEEDFFGMAGHRPPRRPKKRARAVQKQLNTLYPGLWLTEVRADMYKVCEDAPP